MVRPIDLQDNLSKAPLASRAQQVQQSAAEMAQRQMARETQEQRVVNQGRALPAAQAEGTQVNPEGQRHGRQQRQGRRDAPPSAAPVPVEGTTDVAGHIDIVA